MEHIAHRIEALRVAKGLSETQLAIDSTIPRMTLKRRLLAPASFTFGELQQVANALGTTWDDLAREHKASA